MSAELLFLLLTIGFAAAILLHHVFAWAARLGQRVHLWGAVWAAGVLAWSTARIFEITTVSSDPAVAGGWSVVAAVAMVPQVVGLVGVVGTARLTVLPPRYGWLGTLAVAVAGVLGLIAARLGLLQVAVHPSVGGAAFVAATPSHGLVVAGLVSLALLLAGLLALAWRQRLDRYLRALLVFALVLWVGAQVNDLLMSGDLVSSAPLIPHAVLVLGLALIAVVGSDSRVRVEDLAIVIDVHRRNLTEQNQLLAHALADAREAGEARRRFLARMSHELRTPLNGILGMTELALDSRLDETQRRYLEQSRRSAEQLLALVDDLLDLSRMEAGHVALADEPFPLRTVLEDCMQVIGSQAARKGLELVLDAPSDLPQHLVGDPVRLRQVLVNLLGNAVKFTEKGEVALHLRATTAHQGRLGLRFEVCDTGPGILEEDRERILEPFGQGAAGEGKGTGLGLAICAELLRRMDSSLDVESVPGKGSTFSFELQLGLPEVQDEITLVDPIVLQGLRVLVAEDHPAMADFLQQELSGWRVLTTRVADGAAALTELRSATDEGRPYPLLLLDADMPEVDGWAVLEVIAAEPWLVGATVMMLPAGAPASRFHRSRELGAHATICKPVRPAELMAALLAALGTGSGDPGAEADLTTEGRSLVRVLVADDNAVNRELVVAMLAGAGVRVEEAEDGAAAVEAVIARPFDLVLMDVRMPNMDGDEATRQIRAFEADAGRPAVPIVALTAHAMPGDRERLLASGMDGYLTKPVRRHVLLELLDRHRGGMVEPPDPRSTLGNLVPVRIPAVARAAAPGPAAAAAAPPPPPPPPPTEPVAPAAGAEGGEDGGGEDDVIDRERLMQTVDYNQQLARDLASMMLDELPAHEARLARAFDLDEAEGVWRAAHALGSPAGNMAAWKVHAAAFRIVEAARSDDMAAARAEYPHLLAEIGRLRDALVALAAPTAPAT